jgi:hypothetical protein
MAKRVYFTFDYRDLLEGRADVVRRQLASGGHGSLGFFEPSAWAHVHGAGESALLRLIDTGLVRTAVTCALVGSETYRDPGVRYALMRSYRRGNALLVVHINHVRDRKDSVKPTGPNPLAYLGLSYSENGQTASLWEMVEDEWKPYTALDGSATYETGGIHAQYWGKSFTLSQWYPEYNWVSDNGEQNFDRWIG